MALELSRRDVQAVRGFCVYMEKESDETYYQLTKQRDHDLHRYHKVYTVLIIIVSSKPYGIITI